MARHMIRFDTFASFQQHIAPDAGLEDLLAVLSEAAEYHDLVLRRADKSHLKVCEGKVLLLFSSWWFVPSC